MGIDPLFATLSNLDSSPGIEKIAQQLLSRVADWHSEQVDAWTERRLHRDQAVRDSSSLQLE